MSKQSTEDTITSNNINDDFQSLKSSTHQPFTKDDADLSYPSSISVEVLREIRLIPSRTKLERYYWWTRDIYQETGPSSP